MNYFPRHAFPCRQTKLAKKENKNQKHQQQASDPNTDIIREQIRDRQSADQPKQQEGWMSPGMTNFARGMTGFQGASLGAAYGAIMDDDRDEEGRKRGLLSRALRGAARGALLGSIGGRMARKHLPAPASQTAQNTDGTATQQPQHQASGTEGSTPSEHPSSQAATASKSQQVTLPGERARGHWAAEAQTAHEPGSVAIRTPQGTSMTTPTLTAKGSQPASAPDPEAQGGAEAAEPSTLQTQEALSGRNTPRVRGLDPQDVEELKQKFRQEGQGESELDRKPSPGGGGHTAEAAEPPTSQTQEASRGRNTFNVRDLDEQRQHDIKSMLLNRRVKQQALRQGIKEKLGLDGMPSPGKVKQIAADLGVADQYGRVTHSASLFGAYEPYSPPVLLGTAKLAGFSFVSRDLARAGF